MNRREVLRSGSGDKIAAIHLSFRSRDDAATFSSSEPTARSDFSSHVRHDNADDFIDVIDLRPLYIPKATSTIAEPITTGSRKPSSSFIATPRDCKAKTEGSRTEKRKKVRQKSAKNMNQGQGLSKEASSIRRSTSQRTTASRPPSVINLTRSHSNSDRTLKSYDPRNSTVSTSRRSQFQNQKQESSQISLPSSSRSLSVHPDKATSSKKRSNAKKPLERKKDKTGKSESSRLSPLESNRKFSSRQNNSAELRKKKPMDDVRVLIRSSAQVNVPVESPQGDYDMDIWRSKKPSAFLESSRKASSTQKKSVEQRKAKPMDEAQFLHRSSGQTIVSTRNPHDDRDKEELWKRKSNSSTLTRHSSSRTFHFESDQNAKKGSPCSLTSSRSFKSLSAVSSSRRIHNSEGNSVVSGQSGRTVPVSTIRLKSREHEPTPVSCSGKELIPVKSCRNIDGKKSATRRRFERDGASLRTLGSKSSRGVAKQRDAKSHALTELRESEKKRTSRKNDRSVMRISLAA